MKKVILGVAVAAVAAMAVASTASADVSRCEASVPVNTTITTATFTVIQPAQEYNQWNRLWTHNFTVIVNTADNTFSGTGEILGDDQNGPFDVQVPHDVTVADETVTGRFDNGTVTLKSIRVDGLVTDLAAAPTGDLSLTAPITVATLSVSTPQPIQMKVSVPVLTTATTTTPGTESVKNHGQFVKAQGGGKIAAQECAGMPLNSTQGK